MVFLRFAQPWGAAAGMDELPEEVGGVGVSVAAACSADAGVDADEDADEVGGERVGEVVC